MIALIAAFACSGDDAATDDTDVTDEVGDDDDDIVGDDDDDDDDTTQPTGESGDTAPPPPSYASDVAPMFAELCNTCHHAGSAGDYDLSDPWDPVTGFVDRPNSWVPNGSDETVLIDPGYPDNSFLLVKIEELTKYTSVDGNPMPYSPTPLSTAELADVEQWITDGANNDAFFASNVAPIFGTEITFGGASGRCTWCHYPGASMNVLDPFDPVDGMVGRASLWGGTIVVPGDPDNSVLMSKLRGKGPGSEMPPQLRAVTPDEIAAVRAWIERGALDD